MSFDREFKQVVHKHLAVQGKGCWVTFARVYFGNESPNIGFPLLDC
jgi:hypothetical protein